MKHDLAFNKVWPLRTVKQNYCVPGPFNSIACLAPLTPFNSGPFNSKTCSYASLFNSNLTPIILFNY
jgi:hypothetical protein